MPFIDLPLPTWALTLGTVVLYTAAAGSTVHAIMTARTPQGGTAWIIGLLSMPLFVLPIYWVFGHAKFGDYVEALRQLEDDIRERLDDLRDDVRERFVAEPDDERGEQRAFRDLSTLPFTRGNSARLLVDGHAAFDAIFEAIEAAEHYVLAQFFIIHEDQIGRRFQEALIAAAQRGVRTYLLFDEVGSASLPRRYVRALREAGVHVTPFSGRRAWLGRLRLNFRNHRKAVVADGRRAILGGINVGDEYLSRDPDFGHWRDTNLDVAGPSVQGVQLSFFRDWYWSTGEVLDLEWEPRASDEDRRALVLATGPADELETCGLFYAHAIQSAEKRVWIASPYFVPDGGVLTALQLAALRGVDVRLLIPRKADHLPFKYVHYAYLDQTDPAGVKTYLYEDGFMHQKVFLVDDDFAAVGTANLDNRSFRLNFELTVLYADAGFAGDVAAMLEEDFTQSTRFTLDDYRAKPFPFRLAARTTRLLAPIL